MLPEPSSQKEAKRVKETTTWGGLWNEDKNDMNRINGRMRKRMRKKGNRQTQGIVHLSCYSWKTHLPVITLTCLISCCSYVSLVLQELMMTLLLWQRKHESPWYSCLKTTAANHEVLKEEVHALEQTFFNVMCVPKACWVWGFNFRNRSRESILVTNRETINWLSFQSVEKITFWLQVIMSFVSIKRCVCITFVVVSSRLSVWSQTFYLSCDWL